MRIAILEKEPPLHGGGLTVFLHGQAESVDEKEYSLIFADGQTVKSRIVSFQYIVEGSGAQ